MARDHYVAETYLKHFVGPDKMLHVYRKSDGKYFPCHPKDICHEWDGDIIKDFLSDPELLAKYRKIFEPAWNPALVELKAGRVTPVQKLAIAGYWANLLVFTPTQRRIGVKLHDHYVVEDLRAKDILNTEHGKPDPMQKNLLAAIDTDMFRVTTKLEALRAMLARNLWNFVWALYNATWFVLENETGIDLLTSDNPVAFEDQGERPRIAIPRYLPVTPKLCLFCEMTPSARNEQTPDFSKLPHGVVRVVHLKPQTVRRINKTIVQCAEDLVISAANLPCIQDLVKKYARYRVDVDFSNVRRNGAFLLGFHTRVREQISGVR